MLRVPRSSLSSVCQAGRPDPQVDVGRSISGSTSVFAVDAEMIEEASDCTREFRLDGSRKDGEEELIAAFWSNGW